VKANYLLLSYCSTKTPIYQVGTFISAAWSVESDNRLKPALVGHSLCGEIDRTFTGLTVRFTLYYDFMGGYERLSQSGPFHLSTGFK